MTNNLILRTDSYKTSQWVQYPPNTYNISSYIESRGGAKESVFFGLQAFMMEYLTKPITKQDIEEAKEILTAHGMPFNEDGWKYILDVHNGYLPINIEAVPEGMVLPTCLPQVQVTTTDRNCAWLVSYLETSMLRGVWYPSTVATNSREMKKFISHGLEQTSDIPVKDQIDFKLHDFGARGVSSSESATLGGMAHLINFMGTDTIEALMGARKYYDAAMPGYSIPASEHSTMTSWGKDNEEDAFKNMLECFIGEKKLVACVSDSYDIYNATKNIIGGSLKEEIVKSGGTLIVRPDSGSPTTVPVEVTKILMDQFGYNTNSKGYKVLPDCVRVIQGDGIDKTSLPKIISNFEENGLSLDNIAFGMGGGLLQQVTRDDLKYAMKASARWDGSVWHDVFKSPIHGGKTSKKGRLATYWSQGIGYGEYMYGPREIFKNKNIMQPVFENGKILKTYNFDEVRENAKL